VKTDVATTVEKQPYASSVLYYKILFGRPVPERYQIHSYSVAPESIRLFKTALKKLLCFKKGIWKLILMQLNSVASMPIAVIAEDEILLRALVSAVLEQEGFEVKAFGTGDEALSYLESTALMVSIIVSDVRMPGRINGIDLAHIVAKRWPFLPTLLMSGYVGLEVQLPKDCPFLRKPWTIDQLATVVQDIRR
jgi:CheY-like chemotaxis protein